MPIYRAGLLTSVFSHIVNVIEPEYLNKIFTINAFRHFTKESPKSRQILPYLRFRSWTENALKLNKASETTIPKPEWGKIIKTIRKEGFVDLTVTELGILTKNTRLTEIIEESIKKKIAPTRFVIHFKSSTKSAKEAYIKRDLLDVMRNSVEKLGLKYSTLELAGIYTLQDWRGKRKYNLLTTEKINLEKKDVREIIETIFKPTIRLGGREVKVRFIKWYTMTKGNILKLAGFERV